MRAGEQTTVTRGFKLDKSGFKGTVNDFFYTTGCPNKN